MVEEKKDDVVLDGSAPAVESVEPQISSTDAGGSASTAPPAFAGGESPSGDEQPGGEPPAAGWAASGETAPGGAAAPGAAAAGTGDAPAGAQEGDGEASAHRLAEVEAGYGRQIRTYQDVMDALRPETKEDAKKRERRERSMRIISAVSDGLSALGNLYYTSRYAPNMYDPDRGSMAGAVNGRIERAKAERERKRDQYMNFALKLGDAEIGRAKTLAEMEAQLERQKLAREDARRKAEEHGWLALLQPDIQREQAAKADMAGHNARAAEAKADNAPAMQQARLATENARRGSYEASAANSRASAAAHGRTSVVHHFNGKEYPQGSNDYEKDVREAARQYNASHGQREKVTDQNGQTKWEWRYEEGFEPIAVDRITYTTSGYRVVPRKAEEYAGEVETRLAEDKKPPSTR